MTNFNTATYEPNKCQTSAPDIFRIKRLRSLTSARAAAIDWLCQETLWRYIREKS